MLELRALELSDMETIRGWRAGVPETLRTPYLLTREQQEDWYSDVICDRRSTTRYWGLWDEIPGGVQLGAATRIPEHFPQLVGYGGIEHIEWENRRGEISLLVGPEYRGKGYGREAVRLFLEQAFHYLNLEWVWGECYTCGHTDFWRRCVKEHGGSSSILRARKYYDGIYYDSLYFTFGRGEFTVVHNGEHVRELVNGGRV